MKANSVPHGISSSSYPTGAGVGVVVLSVGTAVVKVTFSNLP